LTLLILIPIVLAGYFLFRGNVAQGILLASIAGMISFWLINRLREPMERFGIPEAPAASVEVSNWPVFEWALRVIVFGLLLAIPVGLSLVFLVVYDNLPVTAFLGVIAAGIAPWVIRKLKSEIQP
jgi:hypothetical protein